MNHYTINELEVKKTKEQFTVIVTEEMMQAFLKTTGDNNPMHTDDEYARTRNCSERIVYGMLTASFYSTLVGVYLPGEYCLLQEVETSFHHPVYVGDELTVFGEVIEKNETLKRVSIKATIVNQEGKRVSKAKIKVGCYK